MARNHARLLERPHLVMDVQDHLGGGFGYTVLVPARTHWELQSAYFEFTTDVNVADRIFRLETGPAANIAFGAIINTALTADTTFHLFFGRGFGYFNNLFTAGQMTNGWPAGMIIPGTHTIRTNIAAQQAGDEIIFARLHFWQWQDPVIL